MRVSQVERRVEWMLDGGFRVRVLYICLLNDVSESHDGSPSWEFKLENEPCSAENLLSILNVRRSACKRLIAILSIILFAIECFYRLKFKVFNHVRQIVPGFVWFGMLYAVWCVDMVVVCVAGMGIWILLSEWIKR